MRSGGSSSRIHCAFTDSARAEPETLPYARHRRLARVPDLRGASRRASRTPTPAATCRRRVPEYGQERGGQPWLLQALSHLGTACSEFPGTDLRGKMLTARVARTTGGVRRGCGAWFDMSDPFRRGARRGSSLLRLRWSVSWRGSRRPQRYLSREASPRRSSPEGPT
jgi:hypothetical protein